MAHTVPSPEMLVLVRHGEAENNLMSRKDREHRIFSTNLVPLTALGRDQAKVLGAWLRKKHSFDVHYSSSYVRALETHQIAFPNEKPILDARLIEVRRGVEDLMTDKHIDHYLPWNERKRKEKEGRYHFRPFNGESWADVEMRLRSFLLTLQIERAAQKVVIFQHGKTTMIWRKILENWTGEQTIAEYEANPPVNASVTTYRRKNGMLTLECASFAPWKDK